MPSEDKYIDYNSTKVYYKIKGDGMRVVLIHGFAEDGSIWDQQVEFFQANYKLIIPDIPGSGRSSVLEKENAGMEDYAEIIKNILSAENIDRCTMIGHSMGGYIALAFAEKYPQSLIALGLFHSSAFADDAYKKESRRKSIAFIEKNGTAAFLQTSIPGLFHDPEKSRKDIALLLQKGNNFTPYSLIQYYNAMISRPDRTLILKNSNIPVLIILGEHDKAVPFHTGLKQSHLADHTYICILRESAHMGMLEESGKSSMFLAEFLQSLHL